MEMDPTLRLVKLISFVAYTEGNKCGLREHRHPGTIQAVSDDLAVMAHEMCMYYAGAVRYVQTGHDHHQDYLELADFTISFITNADASIEQLLGEILIGSLGFLDKTNARAIGRKWLDEVLDTCWDSKFAAAHERYGTEQ